MSSSSDWFAEAASEASNTESAKKAAARAGVTARLRQEARAQAERIEAEKRRLAAASVKPPRAVAAVAAAAGEFAAVAAGVMPPRTPGAPGGYTPPRRTSNRPTRAPEYLGPQRTQVITPETALGVIETAVRQADDPFVAAGEWISRVTNALSAIAREAADDE